MSDLDHESITLINEVNLTLFDELEDFNNVTLKAFNQLLNHEIEDQRHWKYDRPKLINIQHSTYKTFRSIYFWREKGMS